MTENADILQKEVDTMLAPKLAIVVSHPIQHFAPFYRALAEDGRVKPVVIFASRRGVEPYFDEGMQTMISWNMDLLGGYYHVFLPEADKITTSRPLDVNNPSIGRELMRQAPDAVLIYGYNQLTSMRALWWCRRNKVPALMISDSELKTPRSNPTKLVKGAIVPSILKQFTAFLTVGDCNEDYYRHYGIEETRFFRSPFTIDEHTYRDARTNREQLRRSVREELGIGVDEIVALTVGKLSERKRPRDVIDVARKIKAKGEAPTLSFLLAGNGEVMDELVETVEQEALPVRLPGFINVDKLAGLYAAADMILHPSSRDPHALVMSEATCVGLPLVISDRVGAAGSTDVARAGENTIVFPCGDLDAIERAVLDLAANDTLRTDMGARSMEIFDELDMRCSVEGAVKGVLYAIDQCKRQQGGAR